VSAVAESSSSVIDLLAAFAEAGLPYNNSSLALENARVALSGHGYLVAFTVSNTKAAAQFIQFHDTNAVPSDGAVPVLVFTVAAQSDRTIAYTLPGRFFQRGIVLCNSSTAATKTVGSADCFFDVQYLPLF
jgi:hypothetical protein